MLGGRFEHLEEQLQNADHQYKLLSAKVEKLKSDRAELQGKLVEQDHQLESALHRAEQQEAASKISDAHSWWAYVWHGMKEKHRQQQLSRLPVTGLVGSSAEHEAAKRAEKLLQTEARPGDLNFDAVGQQMQDATAVLHEAKLKENMRDQAIEISKARQVRIHR